MTDYVRVGSNGLIININCGVDLTEATGVTATLYNPDGTLNSTVTATISATPTDMIASATFGNVLLTRGKYIIYPTVTFATGAVFPGNAAEIYVLDVNEVGQ